MPWIATSLAEVMGDTVAKANAASAELMASISRFDKQVQANLNAFDAALEVVGSGRDLINKLQSAGIYTLILSPGLGSWSIRAQLAANDPPSGGYSCGFANIIVAADLQASLSSLAKLKAAFDTKVAATAEAVTEMIDDISDEFTPETDPAELELIDTSAFAGKTLDDLFVPNTWHSATLGDVFGGAMQVTADGLNAGVNAGKAILRQRNAIKKAQAFASKGLNIINHTLEDLAATGVYNIILEPAAGGYLTRLQNEAGAPPSDQDMYSAGIICIATAPSANELLSRYETMTSLLGG